MSVDRGQSGHSLSGAQVIQREPSSDERSATVAASSSTKTTTTILPSEKENARDSNGLPTISSSSIVVNEESARQAGKELRKWQHNELERRRKDKISAGILRLGELLPDRDPRRMAKVDILSRACTYITYLRDLNEQIMAGKIIPAHATMVTDMRKQIRELEKVNSNYMRLLQKLGISLCSEPIAVAKVPNPAKSAAEEEAEKNAVRTLANKINTLTKEGAVTTNLNGIVSSTTTIAGPKQVETPVTFSQLGVGHIPLSGIYQSPLMQLGQTQPILMINDQSVLASQNVLIPQSLNGNGGTQQIILNGPGGSRFVNAVSNGNGTDLLLGGAQELLCQDPKTITVNSNGIVGGHQILSLGNGGTILLPSGNGGLFPIVSHASGPTLSLVNSMNQSLLQTATANAAALPAKKPIVNIVQSAKPVVVATVVVDDKVSQAERQTLKRSSSDTSETSEKKSRSEFEAEQEEAPGEEGEEERAPSDLLAQATEGIFSQSQQETSTPKPPTPVPRPASRTNQPQAPSPIMQATNQESRTPPSPLSTTDSFATPQPQPEQLQQAPAQPELIKRNHSNLPTVAVNVAIPGPTRLPVRAKNPQPAKSKSVPTVTEKPNPDAKIVVVHAKPVQQSPRNQRIQSAPAVTTTPTTNRAPTPVERRATKTSVEKKPEEKKRNPPRTVAEALKAEALKAEALKNAALPPAVPQNSLCVPLMPPTTYSDCLPPLSMPVKYLPSITTLPSMVPSAPLSGPRTIRSQDCNFPRLPIPPMNYRQNLLSTPVQDKNVELRQSPLPPRQQDSDQRNLQKNQSPAQSPRPREISPIESPEMSNGQIVESHDHQHHNHHHHHHQHNHHNQQQQQQQPHQSQQQLCNYSAESLIGPPIVQFPIRSSSNHLQSSYSTESLLQGDNTTTTLPSAGSPTYITTNKGQQCSPEKSNPQMTHYSSSDRMKYQSGNSSTNNQIQQQNPTTYTPYNLDNFGNSSNYCPPHSTPQQNNNFVAPPMNGCDYFAPRQSSNADYVGNTLQGNTPSNGSAQNLYQGHNQFHPQSDFPPPPPTLNLLNESSHLINNFVPPPVTPVPPSFSLSGDKNLKQNSTNIFAMTSPSKCAPSYAPTLNLGNDNGTNERSSSKPSSSKPAQKTRSSQSLDSGYTMADRSLGYFDFNMTPTGSFNNCPPPPTSSHGHKSNVQSRPWPVSTASHPTTDTSYLFTRSTNVAHNIMNNNTRTPANCLPPTSVYQPMMSNQPNSTTQTNFNLSNIFPDIGVCGSQTGVLAPPVQDSLYSGRAPPPPVIPPNAFNGLLPPPRHTGSTSRSSTFGLFE